MSNSTSSSTEKVAFDIAKPQTNKISRYLKKTNVQVLLQADNVCSQNDPMVCPSVAATRLDKYPFLANAVNEEANKEAVLEEANNLVGIDLREMVVNQINCSPNQAALISHIQLGYGWPLYCCSTLVTEISSLGIYVQIREIDCSVDHATNDPLTGELYVLKFEGKTWQACKHTNSFRGCYERAIICLLLAIVSSAPAFLAVTSKPGKRFA